MTSVVFHPTPRNSVLPQPPSEPVAVAPVGGEPTATASVVFGITFNLNGTMVPIAATDIANVLQKGITMELPSPVFIGTIGDFLTWLNSTFGVAKPDPANFPEILQGVFDKITSLQWTVNAAKVVVPPKGSTDPVQYTLMVAAEWEGDGIVLIPNVLTIQGGVFGVTNVPDGPPAL